MALAEVVEAGGHPMQVAQMVQAELVSKGLGEVAEEVLTGSCSGLALEVQAAVVELR